MRNENGISRFLKGVEEKLPDRLSIEKGDREKLSTDQSIYRVLPAAIARPRDPDDLVRLLRLASEERVSLTLRGGGSGTGGAALTESVVVLLEGEYWQKQPELLEDGTAVRVRPGLSYDEVAALLTPLGRSIPADPSSGSISTLGGNIACRASGPHAFRHGSMDRYLRCLQIVDGRATLFSTDRAPESERRRALESVCAGISPALRRNISAHDTFKSASGPKLSPFLTDPCSRESLTSLFCGSLGAFGIVTEAILETIPLTEGREVVLYAAGNDEDAVGLTEALRGAETFAVEIIDSLALRIAGRSRLMEEGFLSEAQRRVLARPGSHLLVHETTGPGQGALSRPEAERFWKLRKAMLWQVGRFNRRFPAYSIINDLSVPRERLGELIAGVRRLAREQRVSLPFYGHAGDANLHFRPLFRKDAPDLETRLRALAEGTYALVTDLGGSVTGEHGLGRLRAPFLELEWGRDGMVLFESLKEIFDPLGVLNPGSLLPIHDLLEDFKEWQE